jgi:hypothetical protein
VRVAGALYDSIAAADIERPRFLALGRFLIAKYRWNELPIELNDARLALLRSAEDNLLKRLPDLLTLVQAPVEEPVATPETIGAKPRREPTIKETIKSQLDGALPDPYVDGHPPEFCPIPRKTDIVTESAAARRAIDLDISRHTGVDADYVAAEEST